MAGFRDILALTGVGGLGKDLCLQVRARLGAMGLLLVLTCLVLGQGAALAQSDETPRGAPKIVSETRFGVLAHDVDVFAGGGDEDGPNINGEILFVSPEMLGFLWSPRPHIGGSFNTQGDTSQGYLGLTWDFDLTDWLFFEFSLGGTVHDGKLDPSETSDRSALGCAVLFRESVSLGIRFDEHHSLSAMFDHISNANLCDRNNGLESFGVRYGYRF